MSQYKIITETNADFSQEMINNLDVHAIPMRFIQEDVEYENYADGRQLAFADFYTKLRDGKMSTTNQISMDQYRREVTPFLEQGLDILHICFSSGLSGSYNTCCITANELMEEYPGRKIVIVDSLCASMGLGLLVYYAVQQKNSGKTLEEVAQWATNNRENIKHWFTVDDLTHLKRGGRVSSTSALVGTMLNIKPILNVQDGKLVSVDKARGRRKSLDMLFEQVKKEAYKPEEYIMSVVHADSLEDASYLQERFEKELGFKEVLVNFIGPVIGGHAGPGAIAVLFVGKELA